LIAAGAIDDDIIAGEDLAARGGEVIDARGLANPDADHDLLVAGRLRFI
jgi:hypothetical protein